eukprot:gb/GECH01010032.1/.p1 GENE.gb/GECH01010032.1/~~gb/GECH01010032.1/.p1  ORF type:complete len:177 (+),score=17.25 gb/GECH01010032.1/:1-531(+)
MVYSRAKILDSIDNVRYRVRSIPFLFRVNRWFSIIAGCVSMIISGTEYMFSVYAPTMKEDLNYHQEEINAVGTAENIGQSLLGVATGYFYDFFGPRTTIFTFGTILGLAYIMLFWVVQKSISTYFLVPCTFMLFTGVASTGCYTGALATNIRNFHEKHRGCWNFGIIIWFIECCIR